MNLLLLSNSTNFGGAFLGWPEKYIQNFLEGKATEILFIPYAAVLFSYEEYLRKVAERFESFGFKMKGIHNFEDPKSAIENAKVIAVGGGNTFNLLDQLYQLDLLDVLRNKVNEGTPYIGWSAGANIACPTIHTTNDMPVVMPPSMKALGLIPFQINPHYTERIIPNHSGETREMRIREFLEKNPDVTVAGLSEGTLLRYENNKLNFDGRVSMKVFRMGKADINIEAGENIDWLMSV
ncbi:MAG: dipeptidase PepE [Cyclobacteriaceae bacterium]|nr:dipeptidase PepE [Cyclobacteriaceae bacterium]